MQIRIINVKNSSHSGKVQNLTAVFSRFQRLDSGQACPLIPNQVEDMLDQGAGMTVEHFNFKKDIATPLNFSMN